MGKPVLQDSKRAICDWIMAMSVKDYYDFMGMVMENTQISVIETINGEMFFSCKQCMQENGDECEERDIDDGSKCYQFFCEHYGIKEVN